MGPIDALWHILALFLPALATGLIAGSAAKWLWRRELAHVSWVRLVAWPSAAGSGVMLAGLAVLGRDGRISTYALMVGVAALALWWVGFATLRR